MLTVFGVNSGIFFKFNGSISKDNENHQPTSSNSLTIKIKLHTSTDLALLI